MDHDQFVCEIRCPVHGFIGLTRIERDIVDHPAFQRLRRIKQLAWTDYVYPGASHTRFEHSLGVMHLASRLYEAIVSASKNILKEAFNYTDGGLARHWQIVRLAALLHDVGHAPFSHAAESLLPMKQAEPSALFEGLERPGTRFTHEDYSVSIIRTVLKEVIEQHPSNRRNHKISADEVIALISKDTPGGVALFWKDITSGQLDADRMDYLLRDSLHAGVSYGRYDLDRIIGSVCAVRRPGEESSEPKIAITKGGIHAAEAMIVARYWMHKQVYFHKTRLAFDHHLQMALGTILQEEAKHTSEPVYFPRPDAPDELKRFLTWDDYRVMNSLASGGGGEHGRRLMSRDHFRLICELELSGESVAELDASRQRNEATKTALTSLVKFIDEPKASWYKTSPESELLVVDNDGITELGKLSQFSGITKSMNSGTTQFVYVDKCDVKKAQAILTNLAREHASSSTSLLAEAAPVADEKKKGAVNLLGSKESNDKKVIADENGSLAIGMKKVHSEAATKKGIQDVI